MQTARNEALIEAIKSASVLDEKELSRGVNACAHSNTNLEQTLLELGLIGEERLAHFLSNWLSLKHVDQSSLSLCPILGPTLEAAYLRTNLFIPLEQTNNSITLAMADPRNEDVIRSLALMTGKSVDVVVATPRAITSAIDTFFSSDVDEILGDDVSESDLERLKSSANDGPIVQMVQNFIMRAVDLGASDIHFEAMERHAQVRFRQDGILKLDRKLSEADMRAVASRLKIMARLNISEVRRPQDGRVRQTVRGRHIDLRLSTLPTQFGESIVLRVLDQSRLVLEWSALGFTRKRAVQLDGITRLPHGIFLVTGPTGSGKTTTLYTALSRIDQDTQKIVTIEDPIEYSLPGINQTQVQSEIEYGFPQALRAVLRQDFNVVMIGEIRDEQTAENAIRAALMGRLVLSTVHTNSAVGAIDRLRNFGVPDFLLASTLRAVLSQRLVRRLCHHCSGVGCHKCENSGLKGRVVVSELLEVSSSVSGKIDSGSSTQEIYQAAKIEGFELLSVDGQRVVDEALSSRAEVETVL